MKGILRLAVLGLGLGMAGCGEDFSRPKGSPETRIYNGYYGAVYKRPAVTTEDRALSYWAQDIAEDYAGPRVKDAPASLAAATLSLVCSLPEPSAEALVVFVEISGGYDDAPLHFFTDNDVEGVRRSIEVNRKRPDLDRMLRGSAAEQVDVFVTEGEQPVYLVLGAYNATIWSLQIAEGARLDGVSVIGYEPQALAHGPDQRSEWTEKRGDVGFDAHRDLRALRRGLDHRHLRRASPQEPRYSAGDGLERLVLL